MSNRIARFLNERKEEEVFSRIIGKKQEIQNKDPSVEYVFLDRGGGFFRRVFKIIAETLNHLGSPCYFLFTSYEPGGFQSLVYNSIKLSETLIEHQRFTKLESTSFSKLDLPGIAVDLDSKSIECNGLNLFPIVESCLRSLHKKYTIAYTSEKIRTDINTIIEYSKIVICYFELIRSYQELKGCKIRFVGTEISYIPHSIIKLLCEEHSQNRSLEMIHCSRGYNSYFGDHLRSPTLSVRNLTYNRIENRLSITAEEFLNFKKRCSQELRERIYLSEKSKVTMRKRDGNQLNLKQILGFNSDKTKRTYLLLPHLFYDVPLKDESPVFSSMTDWLISTVRFFSGRQDLRLIIKPHPSESYHHGELSKKPNETVDSFLNENEIDLPENIIIVDGGKFSIADLNSYFDVGLVWRSTAGVEMAILGKPSIIAGPAPYSVLDLNFATSHNDYFSQFDLINIPNVRSELSVDASLYLYYLRNYMRFNIGVVQYDERKRLYKWNLSEIENCLKGFNSVYNRMMERFIE